MSPLMPYTTVKRNTILFLCGFNIGSYIAYAVLDLIIVSDPTLNHHEQSNEAFITLAVLIIGIITQFLGIFAVVIRHLYGTAAYGLAQLLITVYLFVNVFTVTATYNMTSVVSSVITIVAVIFYLIDLIIERKAHQNDYQMA